MAFHFVSRVRFERLAFFVAVLIGAHLVSHPVFAQVPTGANDEIVQVRFAEGTDVDPPTTPLPPALLASGSARVTSSASITAPGDRITSRSMRFFSSRTLPG